MQNATGLTITNPLVLYRALIATNRIRPDPAQLRLALHLQRLYERLKDYEPATQYSQRLQRLGRAIGSSAQATVSENPQVASIGSRGIWRSLLREKERRDSLALTRVLSDHEEALKLDSPQGLMVHGEVGTGKSMLIDLFAESLPTKKKRRWHFNTFMLETFAKLEQLRLSRLSRVSTNADDVLGLDDHSMLWLARDLIQKSPILFLDEFQLPDRASAKIMTNLMTGFFGLGGVLVATSNRMPDELAKAAGLEIFQPAARKEGFGWRNRKSVVSDKSTRMFSGHSEFAQFLELLKARCEVWEMEGKSDYRRAEREKKSEDDKSVVIPGGIGDSPLTIGSEEVSVGLPAKYFVHTDLGSLLPEVEAEILKTIGSISPSTADVPWQPTFVLVYGRKVPVVRSLDNVAYYTFNELCGTSLGPADYITLASRFHTFIVTEIPILTATLKNEARRFITLLDALYEAKCKLLISAQAHPDDLFFPELRPSKTREGATIGEEYDSNSMHSETFSEVHQDLTAPFRPNISTYSDGGSIDTTHSRLQGILAEGTLADDALEDTPPNRIKRMLGKTDSDFLDDDTYEVKRAPNFGQAGLFLGEDEKFAYKRATSRLWEMCGQKWWERNEEGWWRPLAADAREWERGPLQALQASLSKNVERELSIRDDVTEGMGEVIDLDGKKDEVMFKHGASPFRTASEPPPKFNETHVWGVMKWGKKAGAWGQGVEGLKDRKKNDEDR